MVGGEAVTTGDVTPHLDVLEQEIAWNERRLATLTNPPTPDPLADDWVYQLSASTEHAALTEVLERQRSERSRLLYGALQLRLAGPPVVGTTVNAHVAERLIRNIRHLAESLGANPRIGIPRPGSHIIAIVPEDQRQMGDPFEQTADTLLDALATVGMGDLTQAVQELAERTAPATVKALSTLITGIANDGLVVAAELESRGRTRKASLDRRQANDLARAFSDAERLLRIEIVTGILGGALEGAGRFEIRVGGDTLQGSIPTGLRSGLDGLTLGRLVRATIQRSTTTYSSGRPPRESISLVAIEAVDE
jgi:hypothetical protein